MRSDKQGLKVAYAKSINPDQKTAMAYVSTFDWDRTDEKFSAGAWKLDDYKRNPVVMWQHDYTRPPIGKATRIEEDQYGLFAETKFADDEFGQQIFKLFEGGFLSAFSVGFAPKQWTVEPIDAERKGIVYTDAALLEYSAVSIPANPGALISRELGEIAKKTMPDSVQEVTIAGEPKYVVIPEIKAAGEEKDFELSLKQMVKLAKDARRSHLPGNQFSLLKSVNGLFQEIIAEQDEGVDAELLQDLKSSIEMTGEYIIKSTPDAAATVRTILTNIEKVLTR